MHQSIHATLCLFSISQAVFAVGTVCGMPLWQFYEVLYRGNLFGAFFILYSNTVVSLQLKNIRHALIHHHASAWWSHLEGSHQKQEICVGAQAWYFFWPPDRLAATSRLCSNWLMVQYVLLEDGEADNNINIKICLTFLWSTRLSRVTLSCFQSLRCYRQYTSTIFNHP